MRRARRPLPDPRRDHPRAGGRHPGHQRGRRGAGPPPDRRHPAQSLRYRRYLRKQQHKLCAMKVHVVKKKPF